MSRSSSDSPEPSTILTPASGMPAIVERAPHLGGSVRGRSAIVDVGADLLEQELGGVVVALLVHEADELPERRRVDRARVVASSRRDSEAHPPLQSHAGRLERLGKDAGGDEWRGRARVAAAIDRERRERRTLVDQERALPARGRAPRCRRSSRRRSDRRRSSESPGRADGARASSGRRWRGRDRHTP